MFYSEAEAITLMTVRQAIITYDAEIVQNWGSAVDGAVSHIVWRALRGEDYPRERGIQSIRHIPPGNELIVAPTGENCEVLMSYSPTIVLPLDMVEHLLDLARRATAHSHGGRDQELVRQLQEEIAGTRKRLDDYEIVVVPKVKLGTD